MSLGDDFISSGKPPSIRSIANDNSAGLNTSSINTHTQSQNRILSREIQEGQYYIKDQAVYRLVDGSPRLRIAPKGAPLTFPDDMPPEQRPAERKKRTAESSDKIAKLERLKLLIRMSEHLSNMLDLQEKFSDQDCERLGHCPWEYDQQQLNHYYDNFVAAYGPINKVEWRNTGHYDKDMDQTQSPHYPNLVGFKKDPRAVRLTSIEDYDEFTGEFKKGPQFTGRWIQPEVNQNQAQNLEEAVQLCYEHKGLIDFSYISHLLDNEEPSATPSPSHLIAHERRLKKLQAQATKAQYIFFDPEQKTWLPRDIYLQGNIYKKLEKLKRVAAVTKDANLYEHNQNALESVIPNRITGTDIPVSIGMGWIPADVIEKFAKEELGLTDVTVTYLPEYHQWSVRAKVGDDYRARHEYGTDFVSSLALLRDALGEANINIRREKDDFGNSINKEVENKLALQKADRLQETFRNWIWQDQKRTTLLEDIYNKKYNATVRRSYTGETRHFSGSSVFSHTLRPHQMEAAIRNIEEGDTGIFHPPGAGKTDLTIAVIHELKKQGKISKPAVVIPNHMVHQFSRTHLRNKPRSNILVLDDEAFDKDEKKLKGIEKTKRQIEVISSQDWDAVYIPQSLFDRMETRPDVELSKLLKEYAKLQEYSENTNVIGNTSFWISEKLQKKQEEILKFIGHISNDDLEDIEITRLEEGYQRAESTLRTLVADQWINLFGVNEENFTSDVTTDLMQNHIKSLIDPNKFYFEDTGIDSLWVDEAHAYKNLAIQSENQSFYIEGSTRAKRLSNKLSYLRSEYAGQKHHFTAMTATPLTNSPVSELYTVFRYLSPEKLADMEIQCFDSFAKMFAKTHKSTEVRPDGNGYRSMERFSRLENLDVIRERFRDFADIVHDADLNLAKPETIHENVAIPSDAHLEVIMGWLAERYDAVERRDVTPDIDNKLKIINDGRLATLSYKLVWDKYVEYMEEQNRAHEIPFLEDEPTKVDWTASRIAQTYHENKDKYLTGPDGEADMVPGGLQLAFCDYGVPTTDGTYNIYEELKEKLIEQGVPAQEIRFIHEYDGFEKKAALSKECDNGQVSVLIASSEKGATGLNVQRRGLSLIHMTPPWTHDWIEQRNGRFDRQGAWAKSVTFYTPIVKGSLDEFSWQTILRKAMPVHQIMSKDTAPNVEEPESDETLEFYAMCRAIAAKDERVYDLIVLEEKLDKLRDVKAGYDHQKQRNLFREKRALNEKENAQDDIRILESLKRQVDQMPDDTDFMSIHGTVLNNENDAQEELAAHLRSLRKTIRESRNDYTEELGMLKGVPLKLKARRGTIEDTEGNSTYNGYEFDIYLGTSRKPISLSEKDILSPKEITTKFSRSVATHDDAQDVEGPTLPERGLVIGKEWAQKIATGEKTWEIRKSNTNIRGPIALIAKGTGTVIGTANLVDCIGPMNKETMLANLDKMAQTQEETEDDIKNGYVYSWVMEDAQLFETPVPYKHNSGAVIWVTLSDQFTQLAPGENYTTSEQEISQPTEIRSRAKIIQKLFAPIHNLEDNLSAARLKLRAANQQLQLAESIQRSSFPHEDELAELEREYNNLQSAIVKQPNQSAVTENPSNSAA